MTKMSVETTQNAPWEKDSDAVLQVKLQVVNERALECEKLHHELSSIARRHGFETPTDITAQLETAKHVARAAGLASSGLFPTGLLHGDFEWFVGWQDKGHREILAETPRLIADVPKCPDFLWDRPTPKTKATISLIQSKRWSSLLPILIRFADCIAGITRQFANVYQESLNQRHVQSKAVQQQSESQILIEDDGWRELSKKPIKILGTELELRPQLRLVLTRLLHANQVWLTAAEIALAVKKLKEKKEPNQQVSSIISKIEVELGNQLNLEFERGKKNRLVRPIQRQKAPDTRAVEYRLHPEIHTLKKGCA